MARVKICPTCGGENPADELFCLNDGIVLADVVPSERHGGRHHSDSVNAADQPVPTGTVREDATTQLAELVFDWGVVAVDGQLNVGRDADFSPLAGQLSRYDTVSRRHAELFVEAGALRVRHLGATNPTYVNDRTLQTLESMTLHDGDTIGFSRSVLATVRRSEVT